MDIEEEMAEALAKWVLKKQLMEKIERRRGIWTIMGGICRIARAFKRCEICWTKKRLWYVTLRNYRENPRPLICEKCLEKYFKDKIRA